MPKSQKSWVQMQHPPTQWNLIPADEEVLNKEKKYQNYPSKIYLTIDLSYTALGNSKTRAASHSTLSLGNSYVISYGC
jgi:hypothetical protein